MSKIELNVLFKKIQKDDKKEVLEFHVQGDTLPYSQDLVQMAGSIVCLEVLESKAGSFPAEFKSIQRDSKKTALKFNVTGDSDDKMIDLYPFAGFNSKLILEPSQMSIEDFYNDEHEGLEYSVENDGTVEISDEQMSFDDVPEDKATATEEIDDDDKLFD